jgi:adenylosuccinate lyase
VVVTVEVMLDSNIFGGDDIEEALMNKPHKKPNGRREAEKLVDKESEAKNEDKEAEDSEDDKKKALTDDELQKQMDELKKLRELVKGAKTG